MYINEIEVNEKIYINATLDENNVELESIVVDVTEEQDLRALKGLERKYGNLIYTVADIIRVDGYVITFNSEIVTERIIYKLKDEDKIVSWENPTILNIKLPIYGPCYLIVVKTGSKPHNRRKAFRQDLNINGVFEINEESINVMVKDISASGIGYFTEDNKKFEVNDEGVLSFFDSVTEDKFTLKCKIVWVEQNGKGQGVGCIFENTSDAIAQYVSKKQFLQRNPDQAWRMRK